MEEISNLIKGDVRMIADRIEKFIFDLISKTKKGELEWKCVDKFVEWELIKKEIEKAEEFNLNTYFIDNTKSYCIKKGGGYVMVLHIRYGKAQVFSPALDKYVLIIKMNDDLSPENLSNYNGENGYKSLLTDLVHEIELQKRPKYDMPEYMYEFFDKVLEEGDNGRITNE